MPSVWFYVLAALGFAFVIAIHEFGHFLMAKWAGVRVEVFSIGFGPKLLKWRWGETEYTWSLLPLGGYVKLTGQEDLPEDPKDGPVEADPHSYLSASATWRAIILLGGVLFNLISSYVILVGLAWWGFPVVRPIIGDLSPQMLTANEQVVETPAARLGLKPGDRVLSVNGQIVRSYDEVVVGAISVGGQPIRLQVERRGEPQPLTLPLGGGSVTAVYDAVSGLPSLGIMPASSNRVEDLHLPAEAVLPADGPQPGDRILAIDDEPLAEPITGQAIGQQLDRRFGERVTLLVEDTRKIRRTVSLVYGGPSGGLATTLGLPVRIQQLTGGFPAEAAGLKIDDVVESVGGIPVCGTEHFLALIPLVGAKGSITLGVLRGRERIEVTVATRQTVGKPMIGAAIGPVLDGPLPLVAPAIDGKPSSAAAAGLVPGDAIVASRPASGENPLSPGRYWVVRGGERILVPLGKDGSAQAEPTARPGLLARLLGAETPPSLASQLIGCRVVSLTGPDGAPTGAPEPGLVQLATSDGSPRTVDLRVLGSASAALLATLQDGDWITGLAWDGTGQRAWALLRGAGGEARPVELAPRLVGAPLQFRIEEVPHRLESPFEAFAIANQASETMIIQSLKMIPRFFQRAENGGLSAEKSLQGPIGIFDELRARAERSGIASWLKLVALIGLNLVLVNLLPIPITDGGQLVILAVESAIRRPLPVQLKNAIMWAGLLLVVGLMLFVIWLDVSRRI